MPITKQSRLIRQYKTAKETFSAGEFLGLIEQVLELAALSPLSNCQLHLQFDESTVNGDLVEVKRVMPEVGSSERLEMAQLVATANTNPQRTVVVMVQPPSKLIVVNAINFPKLQGERLMQLVSGQYPEELTGEAGAASATVQNSRTQAGSSENVHASEDMYLPGLFRPVAMPAVSDRDVFVIMSFSREQRDAYNLAIAPTLKRLGLRPRRIDEVQHNATVTVEIVRHIERSIFVIADLTGERPNVYYEVGYAHRANKEVVLLARKDTAVHFDVAAINRIDYQDFTELVDALEKRIRAIGERLGIELTSEAGDA